MKNKEIKQYIIDKDNFDRIQGYLVEIEQKANELAGKYEKYEKGNNNDFERFFDTLATAGMIGDEIDDKSEKIYYDETNNIRCEIRSVLRSMGYRDDVIDIVMKLVNVSSDNKDVIDYASYCIKMICKYDIEHRGIEKLPKSLLKLL